MKYLLTYIKKEELRRTKWHIIICTLFGLIVTLGILTVRTLTAKEGANVVKFELAGSVPFVFIMFFFGVTFLPRIYKVTMQFGVSRRSAIKVILGYSIIFVLVCAVIGMSLDMLYSHVFDTRYFKYEMSSFAEDMKILKNDNSAKFLLLSLLFNVGFYSVIMFVGMSFVVCGYYFPPKAVSTAMFILYILILFFAQNIEAPFKAFFKLTGAGLGTTIIITSILAIELTLIIKLYLRINCQDKQLVT